MYQYEVLPRKTRLVISSAECEGSGEVSSLTNLVAESRLHA